MTDPKEVHLAWLVLEFLQTIVDLIWEHYQQDFRKDIREHEHRNKDEPWKDEPRHKPDQT
jgi:hypothetical protein